ncbi:conserved hypothetical protein [Burkholderia mallei PRL-20]|uniref:Uncharacterized protein n=1 Tax=Burkholderia mallei (strain NCTC 10229) TaxID=412022 RepID=A2RZF1_BURM9|nr:hypothetical protein BMASAVP1_0982 [Burkholderia mallei SAVP1]ABM98758.2 hypothetical protein BMA10229_1268 [Burkholderia mallei NCTC 10229]ABO02026.1 hypothetical protein BMA10247_A2244 [Burkholderia mallei NCTC 10247]EDK52815.1 hypothetical protein BMAFMH_G0257 [Burkholderia mallei FMH]EDK83332.1 hypothetical protein BMA721280_M0045 [Burkholderia mallei 2002721280]EDP87076.1 hypothetical protein BMA10399_B1665 [Burkholderia mallei ATCC 10399]EEP83454.1 conserved hypothetical protein [Bur
MIAARDALALPRRRPRRPGRCSRRLFVFCVFAWCASARPACAGSVLAPIRSACRACPVGQPAGCGRRPRARFPAPGYDAR